MRTAAREFMVGVLQAWTVAIRRSPLRRRRGSRSTWRPRCFASDRKRSCCGTPPLRLIPIVSGYFPDDAVLRDRLTKRKADTEIERSETSRSHGEVTSGPMPTSSHNTTAVTTLAIASRAHRALARTPRRASRRIIVSGAAETLFTLEDRRHQTPMPEATHCRLAVWSRKRAAARDCCEDKGPLRTYRQRRLEGRNSADRQELAMQH